MKFDEIFILQDIKLSYRAVTIINDKKISSMKPVV